MVRYLVNVDCTQCLDPHENDGCCGGEACSRCGWNVSVQNERNRRINEEGLTLCSDGLRRLIIS